METDSGFLTRENTHGSCFQIAIYRATKTFADRKMNAGKNRFYPSNQCSEELNDYLKYMQSRNGIDRHGRTRAMYFGPEMSCQDPCSVTVP